jgi:APA family basic amino acid/polyamine antiporter
VTSISAPVGLVRGLTLAAATSVVVGTVIGTGIFLKPRVMMCNVEVPWLMLAAWVLAAVLSLAGALTYAELAAMMPRAGGEYIFIREGYGRPVAFLYGWTQFAVAYTGSQAAKGVSFAIFLNSLTGGALDRTFFTLDIAGHAFPFGELQATALGVIVLATFVNCLAVSVGGGISVFLTVLKIVIVAAVGAAAFLLAQGSWSHFTASGAAGTCEGVEATARGGLAGFGAAVLGALWAYDGWTNVTIVAGEVKRPQRNLPLALVGGLLIVAALYLVANVAYVYVLSPIEVASVPTSSSVATEVVRAYLGPLAVSGVAMAMMISTLGSLHTGTMAGARISYAMARDGLFFRPLARVGPRTHVPVNALLLQCGWSCVLALSGSFDTLTDYVIFAAWIFYGLNTASVFIFRKRLPHADRPYRTIGYPVVPAIFLLAAAWLIVNTFVATPRQALIGAGIMAMGLPLYVYFAAVRRRSGQDDEPVPPDEA